MTHVVIHHTAESLDASRRILSGRDPSHRVSAHYLVTDENPAQVLALVPEDRVAYHAGESFWRGRQGINPCSIGIEIVNQDGNRFPYSESQLSAVADLLDSLVRRHRIEPRNIVGHSDIAPGRKVDPGALFPWERLWREHALGTWPSSESPSGAAGRVEPPLPSPSELRGLLSRWGYRVGETPDWGKEDRDALSAFQRHYRPSVVDGLPDGETVARLRALLVTRDHSP